MKSYDLYFQRNGKVYVVNARLNDIDKLILQNFNIGAILTCIEEVKEKMNNKAQPDMQTIMTLAKYLIDSWCDSKCPGILFPADCCDCEYRYFCSKLDGLAKVVGK